MTAAKECADALVFRATGSIERSGILFLLHPKLIASCPKCGFTTTVESTDRTVDLPLAEVQTAHQAWTKAPPPT